MFAASSVSDRRAGGNLPILLERKLFKKISIELSPAKKGRLSVFFESEKDLRDLLARLLRPRR